MDEVLKSYMAYRTKINAYNYIDYLVSWDSETEAPKECFKERSLYLGVLSEERYKIQVSDEFNAIVDELSKRNDLDADLAYEVSKMKEDIEKVKKIPMDEYVAYQVLLAESQNIWAQAKEADDFNMFAPTLEKIIEFNKKLCKYWETDELKGYDVLLNEYEKNMTTKEYDVFFNCLKEKLVPFVKIVSSKKLEYSNALKGKFDIDKQKEFVKYLMDVLCFDKNRGLVKESVHPFTSGYGTNDVRFTVHYYEDLLISSIFSAIHELGHSIYEQQGNPKYNDTFLSGGVSMAMHESQSRFFENIIGRSKEFWSIHYNKLKDIFKEELADVSLDDFYLHINEVALQFIRTEADELTYPLHIMLRYDLEKMMIDGDLKVNDLPDKWNELTKQYLGLDVLNYSLGILQDVHWSGGSIGYFPTYALGSAYASQIFAHMQKDFDVLNNLETTQKINEWLKEKIHIYSSSMESKDIFENAVGKFDPNYYIDYLIEKYSKVYNI